MTHIQNLLPQLVFLVCSVATLMISFFVIGLAHFTWMEWLAVGLASFGLFANSFIIFAKLKNR